MSLYSIEEFKIWKGIDRDVPQWSGIGINPSTRDEAEDMVKMLSGNAPDKQFRIVSFVSQQALDRRRHDLHGALERVKAAEGYARYVAAEIAEMKREAYRQGVTLK